MDLVIERRHLELLKEHAKKELPAEAVAILIGKVEGTRVLVNKVMPVKNVLNSATEFHVDPLELYETYMEAEAKGLEVVGIFHSHPTTSYPSHLDRKYMRSNPVVWLITSSVTWETRAFVLKEELVEINLKITEKIY